VIYTVAGSPTVIAGVAQGNASISSGTFTSTNGRDFNLEGLGVSAANLSGTYSPKATLNGTVTYSGGTVVDFTSTYDAEFEAAPLLSAVSGTFNGTVAFSAGVQAATLTVSGTGAITGSAGGCSVTGSLSPRTDANAFNGSITFGPAPCFFADRTFSGIAYYDSGSRQLVAAAPNAARTDGVLFSGSKP
jgi:hypothetical protein